MRFVPLFSGFPWVSPCLCIPRQCRFLCFEEQNLHHSKSIFCFPSESLGSRAVGATLQVLARRHFSAHPLTQDKTCQDTTWFCNVLIVFEYLELGLTWAGPDRCLLGGSSLPERFDWNNHISKQCWLDTSPKSRGVCIKTRKKDVHLWKRNASTTFLSWQWAARHLESLSCLSSTAVTTEARHQGPMWVHDHQTDLNEKRLAAG